MFYKICTSFLSHAQLISTKLLILEACK